MILTAEVDEVWLDAGPFCRFCEASQLDGLASFLGAKAHWVINVQREISRLSRDTFDPNLRRLSRLQALHFPHDRKGASPSPEVRADAVEIQKGWQEPDDGNRAHLGEIDTVLHAASIDAPLVIIDDAKGRELADARKVPCITTRQLVAEMYASGNLPEDKAFEVYRRVLLKYPEPSPTKSQWALDLAAVRSQIDSLAPDIGRVS